MPHERKRNLTPIVIQALKSSSIVGVIGHRQTGKTTLCEHLSQESTTLDREEDLALCESSPRDFISDRLAPFMVDECQFSPRLFPALKDYVRTHKMPGQFLLTGSVRFTSRRAIQESLTGRILITELLPMTWSESHSLPINSLLLNLHRKGVGALPRDLRSRTTESEEVISQYLGRGGLPGICFSRNAQHRLSKFRSHLDTLLDRDLRLIVETTLPKMTLLGLMATLARIQGSVISWESLRRETGISTLTLKKLFSAFEALFLIRPMSQLGRSVPDTFYFEDAGLAQFLTGHSGETLTLQSFTHFLFCNLRESYHYTDGVPYSMHSYRTRGGAYIPLVINTFGRPLAILPALDGQAPLSSLRSAESFLNAHSNGHAIIVHMGKEARVLHSRLASVPWHFLI
jgi:predicted AAA+ superfamily ATPase